jgi:hypothetical protein
LGGLFVDRGVLSARLYQQIRPFARGYCRRYDAANNTPRGADAHTSWLQQALSMETAMHCLSWLLTHCSFIRLILCKIKQHEKGL